MSHASLLNGPLSFLSVALCPWRCFAGDTLALAGTQDTLELWLVPPKPSGSGLGHRPRKGRASLSGSSDRREVKAALSQGLWPVSMKPRWRGVRPS